MPRAVLCSLAAAIAYVCGSIPAPAQSEKQITILYDAFGPPSRLKMDWGFAALVEYDGRRILFDTGNNAKILEHNVKELGIDLARLDAVVISHRHGDHTTGLNYLLTINPGVKIYTPYEGAYFNSKTPLAFLRREPGLPPSMSYYQGKEPERFITGSPWDGANFQTITERTEILPGFFAVVTKSDKPNTRDMNELSLAVRTPEGLVVVVGCSHPGVEKVLQAAMEIDPRVHSVTGGFHLVLTPAEEVQRVAAILDDTLKVRRIAPGHCTSELGFRILMDRFKDRFDQAGLGQRVRLP